MGNPLAWGALIQPAQDPVATSFAAQQTGLEVGQKLAQIHALQGLDLNNPTSVDNAISGSIRALAPEQASALMNLSFTRNLRQQLPEMIQSLTNTPQPQQAAPQGQADQSQGQFDPQHFVDTYTMAHDAVTQLAALPKEQRPAAFQQIKQSFLQRGIPEQAIDAVTPYLGDDDKLNELGTHFAAVAEHARDQIDPNATAEPPPPFHPISNAYSDLAADLPRKAMIVSMAKNASLDLTPYLETEKALALPGVSEAAKYQFAGPTAAATEAAKAPFDVIQTTMHGIPIQMSRADFLAAQKANIPGLGVGLSPQEQAQQTAAGSAAGSFPYEVAKTRAAADIGAAHDIIQVPEMDATGAPTGRMTYTRRDVALGQAAGPGGIGAAQSPGERQTQVGMHQTFADNYKTEANLPAIQADRTAAVQARAGAALAQSVNPSNITPKAAQIANTLNGLGIKAAAADANKLSTYQQLVSQNLKNGISVFPRNIAEFHAISNAVAGATQPGDAAALALTETAALRDRMAQYKQARIQYAQENPGDMREDHFQAWVAKQPFAQGSIFSSPDFDNLKFNGKPIVEKGLMYKGHEYGIFMPDTPQQIQFKVR